MIQPRRSETLNHGRIARNGGRTTDAAEKGTEVQVKCRAIYKAYTTGSIAAECRTDWKDSYQELQLQSQHKVSGISCFAGHTWKQGDGIGQHRTASPSCWVLSGARFITISEPSSVVLHLPSFHLEYLQYINQTFLIYQARLQSASHRRSCPLPLGSSVARLPYISLLSLSLPEALPTVYESTETVLRFSVKVRSQNSPINSVCTT